MTNTPPRRFVVFWLAHFNGHPKNKGWDTKLVHPRYKDFDSLEKANELIEKLRRCEEDNIPYQSRQVSHVTASWPLELTQNMITDSEGVWPFPGVSPNQET